MSVLKFVALCLLLVLSSSQLRAEENEEGEGNPLLLSADQREDAGIVVASVEERALDETLRVPAEVRTNAYRSARVTPRMQAQVVERHVQLGDHVKAGQPLVTLSSVAMAGAQGALIVADREWRRVQSLGRQTIGEARYVETQIARQQAFAKVLAFGMQEQQVEELLKSGNVVNAIGDFDLLSPLSGTVLNDEFVSGELIEPGRILFEISDESVLWVEARITSGMLSSIKPGTAARISVNGEDWFDGTVVQLQHRLNEITRTQGVRIAVDNPDDQLHPGQFAEAEIVTGSGVRRLAVPTESVTMLMGSTTVFKLEANGEFHPEAVETGAVVGDWVVIRNGLKPGDKIAVTGIFHLKSLLLKSSIGDDD